MFDLCSERLLYSEERFAGREKGYRFVEIWEREDGGMPAYRSGDLKEKEIAGWVHEERTASGPVRSGLRILLSPKPSGKPSSGKLPFTKQTYLALARAWRIPSTYIRAVTQKLSIVTHCSVAPLPSASNNSPTVPWFAHHSENPTQEAGPSTISDRAKCLLVRGDVDWTWDYTLIQIHDPSTHTTHALTTGLTATEIDLLLSYLAYVSQSCSTPTHPALLPLVLLDLAADETASLLKLRVKLMSQIQQRTGMDRFNSLKSATIAGTTEPRKSLAEERQELNLDAVMLRLTCLSDWVAAQRGFIGIQERVGRVVMGMLGGDDDDDDEEEEKEGPLEVFRERLDFVRESLLAASEKCVYLERSISAQVQTVYSLIAQKDNRLNHDAAEASCQIASDSRRIAILTRRDSTDMRIIAAVTMVFLPGTFVATVFSTGLFNWDRSSGESIISRYIWVYFMLTAVLTTLTLLAWGLFSWVQKRRMVRKFGFGLDEEEGSEWGDEDNGRKKRRDTGMTLVDRSNVLANWRRFSAVSWKSKRKGGMMEEEGVKKA